MRGRWQSAVNLPASLEERGEEEAKVGVLR